PSERIRRAGMCVLLMLALGLTAAACGGGTSKRVPAKPFSCKSRLQQDLGSQRGRGSPAWILSAGGLSHLQEARLPSFLQRKDFNQPKAILLVSHGRPDLLAPRASLAFYFTSASGLKRALDQNRVSAAVSYLLLDLERWPLTPVAEQRDPIGALRRAVSVAHA